MLHRLGSLVSHGAESVPPMLIGEHVCFAAGAPRHSRVVSRGQSGVTHGQSGVTRRRKCAPPMLIGEHVCFATGVPRCARVASRGQSGVTRRRKCAPHVNWRTRVLCCRRT
jgi:hypothetical protein